jgi:hypothetical protein
MADKRKHIFLSDQNLIEKLEKIKNLENITFDEMFEKYLDLPDSDNVINEKYLEVENLIVRAYGKKDIAFKDQKLRILMEYYWVMIIQSAKGKLDLDRILHNIDADLKLGTYKKR